MLIFYWGFINQPMYGICYSLCHVLLSCTAIFMPIALLILLTAWLHCTCSLVAQYLLSPTPILSIIYLFDCCILRMIISSLKALSLFMAMTLVPRIFLLKWKNKSSLSTVCQASLSASQRVH